MVYLVGTAHFSKESQDDVSLVSFDAIKKKIFADNSTHETKSFLGHSKCSAGYCDGGIVSWSYTHFET